MKPDEIKKALECCPEHEYCSDCPCWEICSCTPSMLEEVLEYINRVEDKNTELQHEITNCKSEAIKDFGKLLIDNSHNGVISVCDILDYVVEMVGENK